MDKMVKESLLTCALIMIGVGVSEGSFSNGLLSPEAIRVYMLTMIFTPIHALLVIEFKRLLSK